MEEEEEKEVKVEVEEEEKEEKPEKKEEKKKLMYDLYGVVNHSGSIGFGHYYAYCKNKKDGKWYEHNDSMVSEMNPSGIVTSAAYLLFYERRDSPVYHVYQTHSEEEKKILAKRAKEQQEEEDKK